MAVTQQVQTGVARSLEISTDSTTWTQLARTDGGELTTYSLNHVRPTTQTDSGQAAISNKKIGTSEYTLSWTSFYTSLTEPVLEPALETTQYYIRLSDEDQRTGGRYRIYQGLLMVAENYDSSAEQSVNLNLLVNRAPTSGTYL